MGRGLLGLIADWIRIGIQFAALTVGKPAEFSDCHIDD
jgi:hypothetical protein